MVAASAKESSIPLSEPKSEPELWSITVCGWKVQRERERERVRSQEGVTSSQETHAKTLGTIATRKGDSVTQRIAVATGPGGDDTRVGWLCTPGVGNRVPSLLP